MDTGHGNETPLYCSLLLCSQGAECLLEIGADVNSGHGEETPLYCAVREKNTNLVRLLLKHVGSP